MSASVPNWLIAGEWEAELQAAGYSVLGLAVTADEAVTMARSQRPDFVLMDIRLLGPSDGVEAAILIRTQLGIPSIFVSAHDDLETRTRASAAQAMGWLAKPVLASRLVDLIAQLATP